VEYVQSANIIADGFTKVLPRSKWQGFLQQLGLVNIRTKEVTNTVPLGEIQEQLEDLTIT
jgi:hypothetical protein